MEVETTDDIDMDIANNPKQHNLNDSFQSLNNPNSNNSFQANDRTNDDHINYILCPMCQTPIKPNAANLCIQCLNSTCDISEGISKQLVLFQCRQCERFFKNPQWIEAQIESPKLLAVCLKKIRGLSKVKLVDASWIWTEPHSKRLRIKLTIEKEVFNNAIIQKSFEIEFILENQQCDICAASFTHHQWRACVQVRQKSDHKRTFLFLEQLIIRHNMTSNCLGIREQKDGIDFFFYNKSNAQTFLQFLYNMVPIDSSNNNKNQSKRLVSADLKSNITKYKYTFNAEIANICKLDLVLIPIKLQKKCGGKSPIMICYKVTSSLHFIEPTSLHTIELDSHQFFRYRFNAIASKKHVTLFFVMNLKHLNVKSGKFRLMELELIRESDMINENPTIFETITHLGGIIKEGDIVEGYDLQLLSSINDDIVKDKYFQRYSRKNKVPEVIVIKKHYERKSHHINRRKWKLKSLVKDRDFVDDKYMQQKELQDKEEFLRELEEDFDMRCRINVYKDIKNKNNDNDSVSIASATDDDDVPRIPFEELMNDLGDMKLDDNLDMFGQNNNDNNDNNGNNNNTNVQQQQMNQNKNVTMKSSVMQKNNGNDDDVVDDDDDDLLLVD